MISVTHIPEPDASLRRDIETLLGSVDLPAIDLENTEVFCHFEEEGSLVGVIGIQNLEGVFLLRSLAVERSRQNMGIGRILVEHALSYLKDQTDRVYVFTETAVEYSKRFNFKPISLSQVPESVTGSPIIAHCRMVNATPMVLSL
jgi:N-acetylglutamate synthase-like GNAT family acetyltransferase